MHFESHDVEERVELLDHFAVVVRGTVTSVVDGLRVDATVVYDARAERFLVTAMRLSTRPGEEVTGAAMRQIRVQDYLRAAVDHMIYVQWPTGEWHRIQGLHDYLEETAAIVTDREYHAASTYLLAKLVNEPPLKSVADTMKVSQSTATRLIARARERGLFKQIGFKPSSFGLNELPVERLAAEGWTVNHEPTEEILDWFSKEMFGDG